GPDRCARHRRGGRRGSRRARAARGRGEDADGRRRRAAAARGGGARIGELRILPVEGLPELAEGDDLGGLIAERAVLEEGDVVVIAQKAVSKVEGRVVRVDDVEPSPEARRLAAGEDPRRLEVILREAKRVVRTRPPLVI